MAQTWAFGTIASTDQAAGGGTTLTITKPTSTVDGNLLFACVMANNADTITAPAGWNLVDTGSQGATFGQAKDYYRVASGEGASWNWTVQAGGNLWIGFVARYTGLTATPADTHSPATTAGATTVDAPTVTTTATDDLVTRSVVTWNAASVSFAAGTSRLNAGSSGDLMRLYDQDQATAAATGTDTATANASNAMSAFTATFLQTVGGAVVEQSHLLLLGVT